MLTPESISKILLLHNRGNSNRSISRLVGCTRNTVKKYISLSTIELSSLFEHKLRSLDRKIRRTAIRHCANSERQDAKLKCSKQIKTASDCIERYCIESADKAIQEYKKICAQRNSSEIIQHLGDFFADLFRAKRSSECLPAEVLGKDRLFENFERQRLFLRKLASKYLSKKGYSHNQIHEALGMSRKTVKRYIKSENYERKRREPKNSLSESEAINTLFKVLHEPPKYYNINRTSWTMENLRKVLSLLGQKISRDKLRELIKTSGFKWRKARVVLTSTDKDYREKVDKIYSILGGLKIDEGFFSIDEYGPFSVKIQGGKKLAHFSEPYTVPQYQKSKGVLIIVGAIELQTNKIIHFYSKTKNTNDMIKMVNIILDEFAHLKKIYLSWDAASWHVSKKLKQFIFDNNNCHSLQPFPILELASLPAKAQFLNVIESIYSGMSRAIVHNSDYDSVDEAKSAIDKYFADRNDYFSFNPKHAGNKIWKSERTPVWFSDSHNCKDPRYR